MAAQTPPFSESNKMLSSFNLVISQFDNKQVCYSRACAPSPGVCPATRAPRQHRRQIRPLSPDPSAHQNAEGVTDTLGKSVLIFHTMIHCALPPTTINVSKAIPPSRSELTESNFHFKCSFSPSLPRSSSSLISKPISCSPHASANSHNDGNESEDTLRDALRPSPYPICERPFLVFGGFLVSWVSI